MSSEEHPTNPPLMNKVLGIPQDNPNESKEKNTVVRTASNMSSSRGNTEESLSTYAEQNLRSLAATDPKMDITSCLHLIKFRNETGPNPPQLRPQSQKLLNLEEL